MSQEKEPTDTFQGESVYIHKSYIRKNKLPSHFETKLFFVKDVVEKNSLTYVVIQDEDEEYEISISDVYNDTWNTQERSEIEKVTVTNSILFQITHSFYHLIYEILSQINQTRLLVTQTQQKEILTMYRKLTRQTQKKTLFMGPQPVTLTQDKLLEMKRGSLLTNYAVTEKADGFRYLLFIYNKRGYLLNSKVTQVLDTGIVFETITEPCLMDGEYILEDKKHRPIQLFMIFDVYYFEGIAAYQLPFIGKQSRQNILTVFQTKYLPEIKVEDSDFHPFRIGLKKYEIGNEKVPGKLIFEKSKQILQSQSMYEYDIDGLIYLPLNYL